MNIKSGKISPDMRVELGSRGSSIGTENDQKTISIVMEENKSSVFKRLSRHWQMFLVVIVPLSTMLVLCSFILNQACNTLDKTNSAIENINNGMSMSEFVKHLQRERGMSTSYLSAEQPDATALFIQLENLRHETDTSLKSVAWPDSSLIIDNERVSLSAFLESLLNQRQEVNNKSISVIDNLTCYTRFTTAIMRHITKSVTPPDNLKVQKLIVASGAVLSWTDDVGIKRALGTMFFTGCGWPSKDIEEYFLTLKGKSMSHYDTATNHHEEIETKFMKEKQSSTNLTNFIENLSNGQLFKNFKSACSPLTTTEKLEYSQQWFDNMTVYIDLFFDILADTNIDITSALTTLKSDAQFDFELFLSTLIVAVIISCILSTWYFYCIASLTGRLSKYAHKFKVKSDELAHEKKRTDHLLYQMLPKKIANNLKLGQPSPAEHFHQVTIYFSDIVGFTTIGASSEPIEIVTMLNDLYSLFDECIDKYDVYKVETIGDAYMVASGVPVPNGMRHAPEIAEMALEIRQEVSDYKVPHMPGKVLQIRIGIHSGSCVAGVVGIKMPRYCLFGDTVNTASRMESNGMGGNIHISTETNSILQENGNFKTRFRGIIDIKGKGPMPTYWLESVIEKNVPRKTVTLPYIH